MGLVGRLEDLALPEIFTLLSLSRKTGKLVLRRKDESAVVIFANGQVVQAATSSLRESLGHLLLMKKLISENELMAALEIQKCSPRKKRLGAILVEKDFLSNEVLEEIIKGQIEEIVFEVLHWHEGLFNFELGETLIGDEIGVDPQDFLLRNGIKPEYLVMEGTRLFDEKKRAAALADGAPAGDQEFEAFRDVFKEFPADESLATAAPALEAPALEAPAPEAPMFEAPVPAAPVPAAPAPAAPAPPASRHETLEIEDLEFKEEIFPSLEEAPSSPEITALRSMFMELRLRSLNGEITLLIMRYASDTTDRGVLLLVKSNQICGLGQYGIEVDGGSADQLVRSIRIPAEAPSIFSWTLHSSQTYIGGMPAGKWNDYLVNIIGGRYPDEVIIIPMVVENQVVALLYGDNLPSGRPVKNVESLEIFVNQAGLAMEKALLEHRLQEYQKK